VPRAAQETVGSRAEVAVPAAQPAQRLPHCGCEEGREMMGRPLEWHGAKYGSMCVLGSTYRWGEIDGVKFLPVLCKLFRQSTGQIVGVIYSCVGPMCNQM